MLIAAYQVEEFPQHLSVKIVRKLLCTIHTALCFQRKVVVAVLPEGDVLIINPKRFRRKYDELVSDDWLQNVIALNIGGIAPFDLKKSPYLLERLQTSLLETCNGLYDMCLYNTTPDVSDLHFAVQESDIRVVHLTVNDRVVGRDFLLGWLLDYTCIYHNIAPAEVSDQWSAGTSHSHLEASKRPPSDHCLFFEKLLRVTVMGVCPSRRCNYEDNRHGPAEVYMVTLRQFSIPICFLDRESALAYKGMVERSVEDLRRMYLPASWVVQEIVVVYDDIILDSFKLL